MQKGVGVTIEHCHSRRVCKCGRVFDVMTGVLRTEYRDGEAFRADMYHVPR